MKYNPAFLTEEELLKSFVVRHTDLDLLMRIISENTTNSNQHVLVIGPRGSGKTTLLLCVAAAVRNSADLKNKWYPLVFAEESYEVGSVAEFWLEALFHLGQQTGDERWKRTYEELKGERDDRRLHERALAQLMDFADDQGKRILLVVENLNMLFDDQISSEDAWTLRHTLLNEQRIMLLASATKRFEGIDNAGQPMFELFKPHELKPLDEVECRAVWKSITGSDPKDDRIRPIQILTGGNPRLMAIISAFGAKMSFEELMDDLVQLVDDHTEYFKSHLDILAPTERKVYLGLAELWTPSTARDIAQAARLDVNKTSSLLNRLVGRGAVIVTDDKKRTKRYHVAERMYNIYHLMRKRGTPSSRVKMFVHFMVSFYGEEELVHIAGLIAEEARKKQPEFCKDHLQAYNEIVDRLTSNALKERVLASMPKELLNRPEISPSIKGWFANKEQLPKLLKDADELVRQTKYDDAKELYIKATNSTPNNAYVWLKFAKLFEKVSNYKEAEQAFRKSVEVNPMYDWGWSSLGNLLQMLKRYDEAEQAFRKSVEVNPMYDWGWNNLGNLLQMLKRYDEAEQAFRKSVEVNPMYDWGWNNLGNLLQMLKRYDEAEQAFRKSVEVNPMYNWGWNNLGNLLQMLKRYDEAEQAFRKSVEVNPKHDWGWYNLGNLLQMLKRYDEAEQAYQQAISIEPNNISFQYAIANILCAQGKSTEALKYVQQFLKNTTFTEHSVSNAIELFVELAVAGHAKEALNMLVNSPTEKHLEPLVAGLKLFIGEDVKTAVEILEVAKDIVKRIEERRGKMAL